MVLWLFSADTKEIVDSFHAKALEMIDEGKPGLRSDTIMVYKRLRWKKTVRCVVN